MPTTWAYVSTTVVGDDIPSALKEAKEKAISQLGSENVELYEKQWGPDWLCTSWRLVTPDPPPNP